MSPTNIRQPRAAFEVGLLVALAAGLVFAHRDGVAAMVHLWNVSPMYSYGFTVPLVSAYLVWTRRERLTALTPAPARAIGAAVLVAGVLLVVVGRAGGIQLFEQFALVVSLIGTVLFLLGASYLRVTWAALGYLLLMVPVWDAFTEPLHQPFQNGSATIGAAALRAVGVPAFHEGTIIALPNVTLEVARTCSGVNYLVAVVALGLPLAYLQLRGVARRVALIAAAVIVAALSNGLRVALIGVLAYYEIGSPLHGPFHVLHGLFVAGVGYVVLFGGLHVLSRREEPHAGSSAARTSSRPGFRIPRLETLAVVLMFLALGTGVLAHAPRPVPLAIELEQLPAQLGAWWWNPSAAGVISGSQWWPGADREITRRYQSPGGASVDVYVGYFESQQQSKEVATFRSADLHRRAMTIVLDDASGGPLTVNYLRGRDGAERLFWYELDADAETSAHRAKLRTVWNAVVRGRTNAAVVMLTSPAHSAPDDGGRLAELRQVATLVHGALREHLHGSIGAAQLKGTE